MRGYASVDEWIAQHSAAIAAHAERELEALVAISTPSGDRHGAEEAVALVAALAPNEATIERVPCSTVDHAPDLVVHLTGQGSRRVLLLGHLDTVIAHEEHRPLTRDGDRLIGSGAVDMKGGDVLALGVLRALAARTAEFAEAALLLVCDEEWRAGPFVHVPRFAGFDACLCFEGGQLAEDGLEAVVVKRKAAGTLSVTAHGRSAHSGSAPDKGVNALLALASAAQAIAGEQRPARPGAADRRADGAARRRCVQRRSRRRRAGLRPARRQPRRVRRRARGASRPSSAARGSRRISCASGPAWTRARRRSCCSRRRAPALGRPIVGAGRGGASDASHFAATIPLTVDGLGPRGGGAHAPHEYVLATSLKARAEVALAVADAALEVRNQQEQWTFSRISQAARKIAELSARLPRSF